MSVQTRRVPTPAHPETRCEGRGSVPIARGFDRPTLARIVEALERAQIPHAIEDQVAGEAAGTWQVLVPITQAPRALAVIATAGAGAPRADTHDPHGVPSPGPLFESQRFDAMRLLLMLLCFAAAAWLATRG